MNWSKSAAVKGGLSVIASAVTLLALVACAANPSAEPYDDEIARAADTAQSDYVRQILSDGQITAAEVRDSQKQNLACLNNAGISAQYVDNGAGYSNLETVGEMGAAELDTMAECSARWVGQIESISVDQITNPQNKDYDALIAACLVRKSLVPEGFTGADFRELLAQTSQSSEQNTPDESGTVEVGVTGDIVLPGGVSMSNPQATLCRMNPSK